MSKPPIPRSKYRAAAFVIVIFVFCSLRAVCAYHDNLQDNSSSNETVSQQSAAEIFQRCMPCHGDDGRGSKDAAPTAPNFTDPRWHMLHPDDEMAHSITYGVEHMMSGYGDELSVEEVTALVKHIRKFCSFEIKAVTNEQARTLYQTLCVSCHGEDGRGCPNVAPNVPDFTSQQWQNSHSNERLCMSILNGNSRANSVMPPWAGKLTLEEIKGLAAHIRAFSK